MLKFNEYDNEQAEILIDSIRRGEDSFLHKQVTEEDLVNDVNKVLNEISPLDTEETLKRKYNWFFNVK